MTRPETAVQLEPKTTTPANIAKFFIYSLIGIFMFFVPVTFKGKSSIPLDHLVTLVRDVAPSAVPVYVLLVMLLGAIYPFVKGAWKKSSVDIIFSVLKIAGFVVGVMIWLRIGPDWLFAPDMGIFLFEKLVIPVGLLVPVGSVFLALLVSYGLLEFIGVWVRPIMRSVWKTPGRSAIDAVASFVGSYSLALLITNRLFKEGKYTIKEATIIATGFSTVSATFMIIVAKTLGIMEYWNLYFWVTMAVTFLVTAITARIWPISKKSDVYITGTGEPEPEYKGNYLKNSWKEAMQAAEHAPSLIQNVWSNLKDGFAMTIAILPSIMSVGLIGLVLAKFTPVFDWLGYLFYPVTWMLQIPEPLLAAKASAIEIAEMFLPALIVAEAPLVTKFIIAVVSVSAILFFSASIPCILSTEIPLSIWELIIIWFERTIFTLILVTPIAYLLL
ncbi:YjiH family protein [Lihuaxuella thermophila]|uniref:Nucleoside recognition GATE domain-containing membrane protein YjiH n=1 Tax=Lihuaxuella thermophila TaxID=1173111 RepID=A0A1H8JKR4_9BACL|nr:YjiH family protein [Lihuaxuella thermophila]SEN80867.1 nucleoside recognition GATE domain-containing membrane protein YjiH [Lihuaxuella thermophila]